ncbi:hypothetical protein IFM61606_01621 [Aspergillus udagawae]|uniref:Uncharacterized protein n=1 Tax=Aspergillus udagawae TaxID=91492 RepID=A0ABQ1AFR1_9EURO|nr:hypothetical protein IFM51744_04575 [Aspergillus udagawae]GFF81039.1 hypothetical protein IFM53868_03015 [Aspergillus udagawae]GFG04086.1 hypothetical protein IFM5058_01750 [Aspergillus udagawae]GFG21768.1 hypothetical protein IFM61606_01621 [Aspergillus udagawae]
MTHEISSLASATSSNGLRAPTLASLCELTATEHSIWRAFLDEAVDPEYAAQYIWERIHDRPSHPPEQVLHELKLDWKRVVTKCQSKPNVLLFLHQQSSQWPGETKSHQMHELGSKLGTIRTALCCVRSHRTPAYAFVSIMLG